MVNPIVYKKLVTIAKGRGTISLVELGKIADLTLGTDDDTKILGMILDAIADQEITEGRPLLPAVVENGAGQRADTWLFKYARRKNILTVDDPTFYGSELGRVYDYWATAKPPAL